MLAAVTLGTLGALSSACRQSPAPPAGDVIADLALPQLGGTLFDPGTLRGKRVLVNFWSPG